MSSATAAEDNGLITLTQDLKADLLVIEALRFGKILRQQHRMDRTDSKRNLLPSTRLTLATRAELVSSPRESHLSVGRPVEWVSGWTLQKERQPVA